jgi:intraflagellar transport protein 172
LLRVDWAFFQAGLACLDNDRISAAFVFLNHFLDLVDAIEQQTTELDHSDLDHTDIPEDVPLPAVVFCVQHSEMSYRFSGQALTDTTARQMIQSKGDTDAGYQGQDLIEQVRAWILHKSMDALEPFRLPLNDSTGQFESSLVNADGGSSLPCVVTGYPVQGETELEVKKRGWAFNKDDWNKLIAVVKVTVVVFN